MKREKTGMQVIERVAGLAMRLGAKHMADYGATRSRHDFTQRQLMACLILRAYLKTTYRGVLELLAISPNLREALGLADKLPHYTTLQKFSARSQVLAIADAMIRTIGRAAGEPGCQNLGGDGRHRVGNDHRQCAFSEPEWADPAEVGEGFDHRALWQLAAVESGAGLGTGE